MFDPIIAESLVHDRGDCCATSTVVCRRLQCVTDDWLHYIWRRNALLHLNQSSPKVMTSSPTKSTVSATTESPVATPTQYYAGGLRVRRVQECVGRSSRASCWGHGGGFGRLLLVTRAENFGLRLSVPLNPTNVMVVDYAYDEPRSVCRDGVLEHCQAICTVECVRKVRNTTLNQAIGFQ